MFFVRLDLAVLRVCIFRPEIYDYMSDCGFLAHRFTDCA